MKKILFAIMFTVLMIGLIGCSSSETVSKKEKVTSSQDSSANSEIKKYMDQIKPLLTEVDKFGQDFEALKKQSIDGQITDADFGKSIADTILPTSIKLQTEAQQILPSKEVRAAHEKLIDMLTKNSEAMSEIISAVDTGDASKITSANELLSEATKTEREFVYDMQDLAEKNNLTFGDQ